MDTTTYMAPLHSPPDESSQLPHQSPTRRQNQAAANAARQHKIRSIQQQLQHLAKSIEAILQVCRGIQVSDSGYWIHHEDPAALNPVAHVSCPLTGNESSNPALTARRRARAAWLNMPVWRPRFASLPLDQALAASRRQSPRPSGNSSHDTGWAHPSSSSPTRE